MSVKEMFLLIIACILAETVLSEKEPVAREFHK